VYLPEYFLRWSNHIFNISQMSYRYAKSRVVPILPILGIIFFTFLNGMFQDLSAQRTCAAVEVLQQQIQDNPERLIRLRDIEEHARQVIENRVAVEGVITIPVVVHVVHRTATENISEAQILSQIEVLNEDFRRLNTDANNTWPQAEDSEIEFCLAATDPQGNPTNGITRTSTTVNGFGTNDAVKFASSGGKDAWPTDTYLNVWVCNIGESILGYAQFPGGPSSTDGVVNDYRYFGTMGTATAPFNLGRTMTHEVGHWLNLRHIWGDGGCSVDDGVGDTPVSDAANYGCATGHVSCSSTDMVQNYMDYSDDACMNLFTAGQNTRMRALFAAGGDRESILNADVCQTYPESCSDGVLNGSETAVDCGGPECPPCPTCSDGLQNGLETGVDCGGPECDPCPTCNDGIQNGNETGIDCGGSNCPSCPVFCDDDWYHVTLTFDNYPKETSWQVTNAAGDVVASGDDYTTAGGTVIDSFCLGVDCYTFTIEDSYGDGMCCAYGEGSFTVTNPSGGVLFTGGQFGSQTSNDFCVTEDLCNDGIQNGDETGIDCGGSQCPSCPIVCLDNWVYLGLRLDQYPAETAWQIKDSSGTVLHSGSGYTVKNQLVIDSFCLPDACYEFYITDSYGDGICCQFGNGFFLLTNEQGDTLTFGGQFQENSTNEFCVGATSCSDGIQNGLETGVDCGGSECPACPTCNDGLQNGDETGVDCGGSECPACPT
jgi:hypothetical protein